MSPGFSEFGKLLMLVGVVMFAVGFALAFLPAARLGRLPGDITFTLKNGKIFLPITTSILLSLLLSLVLWLIAYFRR